MKSELGRAMQWETGLSVLLILALFLSFGSCQPYQKVGMLPTIPGATAIGSDECGDCHEKESEVYAGTLHSKVDFKQWGLEERCEGCHGPGSAHSEEAEESDKPKKIVAFEQEHPRSLAEVCLTCHRRDKDRQDFRRTEHSLSDVGCTECHQIHQGGVRQASLKQPAPELCYTCHEPIKAEFALPEHHRVAEGAVNCSDCHAHHSGANRFKLREARDEACFNCHSEKRGPWVFEHLSVHVEGCTICHKPHGSNNRHLLTYQDVRSLCLQCHPNTPAFHEQQQVRGNFRNCTICHVTIHGSNTSHVFFE